MSQALHASHIQPRSISVVKDGAGQWIINFRSFEQDPSHVENLILAVSAQHDIRVQAFEGGQCLSSLKTVGMRLGMDM